MSIDGCKHSFKELSDSILINKMEEMENALKSPYSMKEFGKIGNGKVALLKYLNKANDFPGCYVLSNTNGPVYVGISRSVVQRLIQHLKGNTHFNASFAYRIASSNYEPNMPRGKAMKDDIFLKYFYEAKNEIKNMQVAFIEIDNDLELYLFEVFCSMKLNTSKWNTFKTH